MQSICESWLHWTQLGVGLAVSTGVTMKLGSLLRHRASLVFLGDVTLRKLTAVFLCSVVLVALLTSGNQTLRIYRSVVGCGKGEEESTPFLDSLSNYSLGVGASLMTQSLLLILFFRSYVIRHHREYQQYLTRNLTIRSEIYAVMVMFACFCAFLPILEVSELTMSLVLTFAALIVFFGVLLLKSSTEAARNRVNEAVNVAELAERKAELEINDRLLKLFFLPTTSFVLLSTIKIPFIANPDLRLNDVCFSYFDVFLISSLLFLFRLCFLSALQHPRFRHLARVNFVDATSLPSVLGCIVDRPIQAETRLVNGLPVTVGSDEVPRTPLMSAAGRAHHTFYACLLENSWISKMRAKEEWTEEMRRLGETLKADGMMVERPQQQTYRVRPVADSKPIPSFSDRTGDQPFFIQL